MPIYYFAYGSNMSQPQMQRRCPGAQPAGRGVLPDWRLVITVRGSANIRFQEGAATHGVLWRFEPHHIGLMDLWEGVSHRVYRRTWVRVTRPDGRLVTALTYICSAVWPGRSRPGYVETAMLPGAAASAIPEFYQDEIRSWLPRRPIGARRRYNGRRTPKRQSNS